MIKIEDGNNLFHTPEVRIKKKEENDRNLVEVEALHEMLFALNRKVEKIVNCNS